MFERAYSHCREACTFIGGLALGMYTFGYTYVHIPIWASTEFDRDFLNYSEKFKKEKKLLWATSKNASTRIKYVRKICSKNMLEKYGRKICSKNMFEKYVRKNIFEKYVRKNMFAKRVNI
jgi:hypothetical protein